MSPPDHARRRRFEQVALPHLDSAYSLARWLTRNDQDAEDVVQEAFVRALRFIDAFHGTEGRAWLLAIVRNTCFSWMEKNRPAQMQPFDEDSMQPDSQPFPGPESASERAADSRALHTAIAALPPRLRETLVLRELEELSYKEIARIAEVPIGTVMSRLSRARALLARFFAQRAQLAPDEGNRQ
jgi:RNA polymerase sigma-70 factor (ECF subfamily)